MTTATEAMRNIINARTMLERTARYYEAANRLNLAMTQLACFDLPSWSFNPETGDLIKIESPEIMETRRKYQEILATLHERIVINGE